MENANINFSKSNVYEMRFITDYDLRPHFICVKTTPKTASFQRFGSPNSEIITKRIKTNSDGQYIVTDTYSMAPIIRAKNIVA